MIRKGNTSKKGSRVISHQIRLITPAIATAARMLSSPPLKPPIMIGEVRDPIVTKKARRQRLLASDNSLDSSCGPFTGIDELCFKMMSPSHPAA
jgi:hypothetical protein